MRAIANRLHRLEESPVASFPVARRRRGRGAKVQPLRIQCGYLKKLPGD